MENAQTETASNAPANFTQNNSTHGEPISTPLRDNQPSVNRVSSSHEEFSQNLSELQDSSLEDFDPEQDLFLGFDPMADFDMSVRYDEARYTHRQENPENTEILQASDDTSLRGPTSLQKYGNNYPTPQVVHESVPHIVC
jgi:hypothetical protein